MNFAHTNTHKLQKFYEQVINKSNKVVNNFVID